MSRILRIPAGNFTQPGLPNCVPFSKRVGSLPNLRAWFNGYGPTVERNLDNRLIRWMDRSGNRTILSRTAQEHAADPLFVENAYLGRNCLRFTKANRDALTWSAQRATGAKRHTLIMIADIKPVGTGPQFLVGDITPYTGWNILNIKKEPSYGMVDLYTSTGNDGVAGHVDPITIYTNTGRPMLIISVVDAFYNAVKTQINTQPIHITSLTPTILAPDVHIGWSGDVSGGAAHFGADMDLYELIMLENDIFANGNQAHHAAVMDYAYDAYKII